MSLPSSNQTRVSDWIRWISACSKTDPTYKPKALLAVLETDGDKMLLAVLRELKLTRVEQLIQGMRDDSGAIGNTPKTTDPLQEPGEGD